MGPLGFNRDGTNGIRDSVLIHLLGLRCIAQFRFYSDLCDGSPVFLVRLWEVNIEGSKTFDRSNISSLWASTSSWALSWEVNSFIKLWRFLAAESSVGTRQQEHRNSTKTRSTAWQRMRPTLPPQI
jgi:hypothetical protein